MRNSSPDRVWTSSAFIALAMFCAACSSPALQVANDTPAAFTQAASSPAWPTIDWYRGFASAELDQLMEQARSDNLDLAAAEARVRQADARARAAGGALLPQLDIGPGATRYAGRAHGTTGYETDWSVLLSTSYEVDFWGRAHAAANAGRFAALASQADRDTVAMTTLAGVANGYFQLLSLRERLSLARANLDTARELVASIQARFDAGAAAPAELASQRAAVAEVELLLPDLQQQEFESNAALAMLVGQSPETFAVAAQTLEGLTEPSVAPGLPAELLARRPDIFAAEASLRAAHADLAVARAALFPTFTLTASGGVQNPAVQAAVLTLEGTGPSLTVGASLVQSVFDAGRKRAARDEARAHEAELLANYRATILHALVDVETALAAIQHLNVQGAAQQERVTQSERAFEGARLRYRAGSGDYLTMLDAQRTLYAAREQMSTYRLARLQAAVGLCKALGGGWTSSSLQPAPALTATTQQH